MQLPPELCINVKTYKQPVNKLWVNVDILWTKKGFSVGKYEQLVDKMWIYVDKVSANLIFVNNFL